MITEIVIKDRRNQLIQVDIGSYTDDDLDAAWIAAKELGHGLVVSWYRSTDSQQGYWSDKGASIVPVYT